MHLPLLDPLFNLEADACWQVLWQAVASCCGRWRIGWPFLKAWLASRCLRCPRLLAFACKGHVCGRRLPAVVGVGGLAGFC